MFSTSGIIVPQKPTSYVKNPIFKNFASILIEHVVYINSLYVPFKRISNRVKPILKQLEHAYRDYKMVSSKYIPLGNGDLQRRAGE